jgi:hypothetical protein
MIRLPPSAALLAALGLFSLAGCDPSKAELELTKQQLATVTAERDQLKGQLEETKAQLAAAAVPAPAEPPKPVEPPKEAHHREAKAPTKAEKRVEKLERTGAAANNY